MARKKIAIEDSQVVESVQDDLTDEEQDALAALIDVEGGAEAQWQIHRIAQMGNNKAAGYLDTLASGELRLDELKRRFGRGKYRVRGLRPNGTYLKSTTVIIAEDPLEDKPKSSAASGPSDVMTMLQTMNEREERKAERSREIMMIALPAAIAALPAVLQAFMGGRQQSDPLQMIAALKTLQPAQPDMSGLVAKLIDVASDKSGGGSSETNWMDLVKEGLGQLGPVLAMKMNTPAPQLSAPPQTQAQIAAPVQAVTTQEEQPMFKLISWARGALAMLCDKAAKNKDTSLYVDVLLDDVPDGVNVGDFIEYLNKENWWQVLQQFHPGVAPYQGWFAQFRDDLLSTWSELQEEQKQLTPPESEHVIQ